MVLSQARPGRGPLLSRCGVGALAALAKGVGLNVLPYYSSGYVHVELVE